MAHAGAGGDRRAVGRWQDGIGAGGWLQRNAAEGGGQGQGEARCDRVLAQLCGCVAEWLYVVRVAVCVMRVDAAVLLLVRVWFMHPPVSFPHPFPPSLSDTHFSSPTCQPPRDERNACQPQPSPQS